MLLFSDNTKNLSSKYVLKSGVLELTTINNLSILDIRGLIRVFFLSCTLSMVLFSSLNKTLSPTVSFIFFNFPLTVHRKTSVPLSTEYKSLFMLIIFPSLFFIW